VIPEHCGGDQAHSFANNANEWGTRRMSGKSGVGFQLGTGTGSCAGSLGSLRFSAASTENSMK